MKKQAGKTESTSQDRLPGETNIAQGTHRVWVLLTLVKFFARHVCVGEFAASV